MRALLLIPFALLVACGPPDPEQVMAQCEERARAARGPQTSVTVGANSESGPFASVSVGITADAIAGRDPIEVYESCVISRTGLPPSRPPDLS